MIKLNLGCGFNKFDGWINVDKNSDCQPDEVWNLEKFPWPWETSSAEETIISHVLEHISLYEGFIKELYRVSAPEARILVVVPHHRHEDFFGDPTHVRPITHEGLRLLSKKHNQFTLDNKFADTPLGMYWDVDFEIEQTQLILDEPWKSQFEDKKITDAEIREKIRFLNNVVKKVDFVLKVKKEENRKLEDL